MIRDTKVTPAISNGTTHGGAKTYHANGYASDRVGAISHARPRAYLAARGGVAAPHKACVTQRVRDVSGARAPSAALLARLRFTAARGKHCPTYIAGYVINDLIYCYLMRCYI
ncbi:hypothetical protein ACJJTC_012268 [Scirpophaga incertulas]